MFKQLKKKHGVERTKKEVGAVGEGTGGGDAGIM